MSLLLERERELDRLALRLDAAAPSFPSGRHQRQALVGAAGLAVPVLLPGAAGGD